MPTLRGGGSKRGGPSTLLNGHTNHSLTKKRSQRFEGASATPFFGGRTGSFDGDTTKSGSGDSTPERDSDTKRRPGSSASTNSVCFPKETGPLTGAASTASQKRIDVGQSPRSPTFADNNSTRYAGVLPPHQYLDSLAITFFLVNLPAILSVIVHLLFVILAVSPYSSATDRYSSWKTIVPAEAFIISFFALVSPSIRAYITNLAEPVIASTLTGNGSRGAAICAAVMFAASRIPSFVLGGFIRLKRPSSAVLSDTIVFSAHDTEHQSIDRLGDELQAWILALVRQLIAIHVVARWSWEGLKRYLTNRVNQSKLEDSTSLSNADFASAGKRKKFLTPQSSLSQMPLWTTIANNYIVATKDAELKPPEDLQSFMFENECSLQVLEVTSCSVQLCARGPRDKILSTLGSVNSFDVCVNGLQWREVSITLEAGRHSVDDLYDRGFVCLYIDIHALVPSAPNEIEITNSKSQDPDIVLFHATICPIRKEATATPALAPPPVRPSSPISTLTDKLSNAVDSLNEIKNNQRRIRKDHKSTVATLRSEIEALHSRLEMPDKGEERARRGNLALKYHIRQTEEKIRKLQEDIEATEKSIAHHQKELAASRGKWEAERSALENSSRSQRATKSTYDKQLAQFHSEKLAINARKEKLTARKVKLRSELEVLDVAERKWHEETDDRAKKRQEARGQLIKERQVRQADEITLVEQLEAQLVEVKDRIAMTHAQRLVLEGLPTVVAQPQAEIAASSPSLLTMTPRIGATQNEVQKENTSPERLEESGLDDGVKEP